MPEINGPTEDPFAHARPEGGSASDHTAHLQRTHPLMKPMPSIRAQFTYHPPGPIRAKQHEAITESCIALGETLQRLTPLCPEQRLAIERLAEVRMWANAALAIHGAVDTPSQGAHTQPDDPGDQLPQEG